MPQYNPVVTPDYLSKMNQVSPLYAIQADNAYNRAAQQDQAGLADLFAQQQHDQQMRPLKLQSQQISNDQGLAQLPGLRAESSISQRKDRMGAATYDSEVSGKLKKMALEADETELKQLGTQAQKMMLSQDPTERKKGQALFDASSHMYELRTKHNQEMEKARLQAETSRYVADKGAESRLAVANTRGAGEKALKSPRELYAYYYNLAANAEDGSEDQTRYTALAQEQWDRVVEEATARAGAAKAGTVDMSNLGGGGIPTMPPVTPGKVKVPGKTEGASVTYKTPDDIKSAYKAGKLTKEQATEMLRKEHGYK
jgi:hypothetical protein